MAKNERDVQLVFRAKDEASKVSSSVAKALDQFNRSAKESATGAESVDSTLSRFADTWKNLERTVKSSNLYQTMEANTREAEQAQDRLNEKLREAADRQRQLASEEKKATTQRDRLAGGLRESRRRYEQQEAAVKASAERQKALRAELKKTQAQYRKNATSAGAKRIRDRVNTHTDAVVNGQATPKRADQLRNAVRQRQAQEQAAAQAARREDELQRELAQTDSRYEAQTARLSRLGAEIKSTEQKYKAAEKSVNDLGEASKKNAAQAREYAASLETAKGELTEVRAEADKVADSLDKVGRKTRVQLDKRRRQALRGSAGYRKANQQATGNVAYLRQQGVGFDDPQMQRQLAVAKATKAAYLELEQAAEKMRRELKGAGTDTQRLADAHREFAAIEKRVEKNVKDASKAVKEQTRAQSKNTQAQTQNASAKNRNADATQGVSRTMDLLRQNQRQTLSFMQRLRGEVITLAGAYVGLQGAIQGVRGVSQARFAMEAAQNRLGVVFDQDQERTNEEIEWLQSQADRLGVQFGVLSKTYAKFAVAADVANYESAATRKIFLGVAEAARVNKLSMQDMELVFTALEQMISKGSIQSEELRRQLGERLPGAVQIMASAMNKSTAEIYDMMKAGQLAATQTNMVAFADQLNQRFGRQLPESLDTFTTLLGRLQNQVFQAQLTAGNNGLIGGLTQRMRELVEYAKSAEGQQFFVTLGKAGKLASDIIAGLVKNVDLLGLAFAALMARRVSPYIRAIGADFFKQSDRITGATQASRRYAAMQRLTQRSIRQTQARVEVLNTGLTRSANRFRLASLQAQAYGQRAAGAAVGVRAVVAASTALRAVLSVVGGLAGFALTAVTAVLAKWLTSTSDITEASTELEEQVRNIKDSYGEIKKEVDGVTESVKEWQAAQKGVSIQQAKLTRQKLGTALSERASDLMAMVPGPDQVNRTMGPNGPTYERSDSSPEIAAIRKRTLEFVTELRNQGTADFVQFKEDLSEIAGSDASESIETLVANMQNFVSLSNDGQDSLAKLIQKVEASDSVIKSMSGNTDKAKEGLRELGGIADKVSEAYEALGESVQAAERAFVDTAPDQKIEKSRQKTVRQLEAVRTQFKNTDFANIGDMTLGGIFPFMDAAAQDNIERFLSLMRRVNLSIEQANINASRKYASDSFVDKIVTLESSGDPNARPEDENGELKSSAVGLGQFTEGRWLELFKSQFGDQGLSDDEILAKRTNGDLSKQMIRANLERIARYYQKSGVRTSQESLYLGHLLGEGGATNLYRADESAPLTDVLGADQISSNPNLLGGGQTVGGLKSAITRKLNISDSELNAQQMILDAQEEQRKKAEQAQQKLDKEIADLTRAIGESPLNDREKFIRKSLNDAGLTEAAESYRAGDSLSGDARNVEELAGRAFDQGQLEKAQKELLKAEQKRTENAQQLTKEQYVQNEAREDGIDLLTKEGQKYAEIKGQVFEITKRGDQLEARVDQLRELRESLQDQAEYARSEGDSQNLENIRRKYNEVTESLRSAIREARAFWQTQSGPEAQVAIGNLDRLSGSLDEVNKSYIDSAQGINESITDMSFDEFNGFFDKLNEGAGIFDSLETSFRSFAATFLKKIAEMILKQTIFNALGGNDEDGGVGGKISRGIGSLFSGDGGGSGGGAGEGIVGAIGGLFGGSGGGGASGGASDAGSAVASIFHSGGRVASGGRSRSMPAELFSGAVRYHYGTAHAGLAPNEVPAILEKGETVRTEAQEKALNQSSGVAFTFAPNFEGSGLSEKEFKEMAKKMEKPVRAIFDQKMRDSKRNRGSNS